MSILILGLVLFLGIHSSRILAPALRNRVIAQRGEGAWKGPYALLSLAGFALIIWGYGLARQDPVLLWTPPVWTRHLAALLVLVAFVLVTAAYVPGNGIKARLHHPMVLGVKVWAFAHLIANQTLADALLFGSFLVWAIVAFAASRRRDRLEGTVYPPGLAGRTALTVVIGIVGWAVFAFWGHAWLIGVRPFG
jgi:uncharacterized membrane protein